MTPSTPARGESADLPGQQRPAPPTGTERLRATARRVAEPLSLPTRENDGLHQRGPLVAARPIAS